MLTRYDVDRIDEILSPYDTVEEIYINFCNPWPKPRHFKRRLTYPGKLLKYKSFLAPGGRIYFKTDDDGLFNATCQYLKDCGFVILNMTRDLKSGGFSENIPSEHEIAFSQNGVAIKALVACLPVKSYE